MAVFRTAQEVYDSLGRLFEELVADPLLAPQFQRADTVVQYCFEDPAATITVDIRADTDPWAHLGDAPIEPEVVLSMDADTAHELFLGRVNLTVALARGQIRARGPVGKILKLVPLLRPSFAIYAAQVEASAATVVA